MQAQQHLRPLITERLRYFLHRDADLQGAVLRVFLRVVELGHRQHPLPHRQAWENVIGETPENSRRG